MVKLKNQFPESFFEEEVRYGFTITRKRKEIWAIELDMLIELDKACKTLGVQYFLDSGTLLGAVRDGHFIPWDDDVDVVMLREDYDRFVKEGNQFFQHPMFLQDAYTEEGYFRMHSQIRNSETAAILPNEMGKVNFNQGIFIDVFPLDGIDDRIVDKQLATKRKYQTINRMWSNPHSDRFIRAIGKKMINMWTKTIYGGQRGLYRKLEDVFRAIDDTEYVDALMMRKDSSEIQRCRKDWYLNKKDILFEGICLPIPSKYKEIMELAYGERWLTPSHIPSLHGAKGDVLFDTEKSYTYYLNQK